MIGIFIGSFNPPHKAHIKIVNYLLNNKVVDKVLIVPTENYWDKQDLIDIKHRINMLKYYENRNIIIDTENNEYPYTYLLMRKLKNTYKEDTLYLIIGADNIINFDKWKEYQELLKYNIIIMGRDNIDINKYIKKYPNGHFTIIEDFNYNVSSTKLRDNINSRNIDEKIIDYIRKNNLYKDTK